MKLEKKVIHASFQPALKLIVESLEVRAENPKLKNGGSIEVQQS
jgi:hypothetical protein